MSLAEPGGQEPRARRRVVRTESLKSERSDKRVSFNNDVGVKHIPRGEQQSKQRNIIRVVQPKIPDEWSECVDVHHEPVHLTAEELEEQAESLVRLLDQVSCTTSNSPNKQHPSYSSRSLDRPSKGRNNLKNNNHNNNINNHQQNNYSTVTINNKINNANNNTHHHQHHQNHHHQLHAPTNNNQLGKSPDAAPYSPRAKTLPTSRTANPINRRGGGKGDVNQQSNASRPPTHKSNERLPNSVGYQNNDHYYDRRNKLSQKSVENLSSSLLYEDYYDNKRDKIRGHKSVHDIPNTVLYDNNESEKNKYRPVYEKDGEFGEAGFKSVDNLYDSDEKYEKSLNRDDRAYEHKSVDNLLETEKNRPIEEINRLSGYKSLGHLPSTALYDSDHELRAPYRSQDSSKYAPVNNSNANMESSQPYRPKVGNIVKRMNAEAEVRRRSHEEDIEIPLPKKIVEPDRNFCHNNNKPFTYTGGTTSRLSPTREIQNRSDAVYAQVNKIEKRERIERTERRNHFNQQYDMTPKTNSRDPEYSAKIIITDNNDYKGYEDDDDAYESYQVTENSLRRFLDDDVVQRKIKDFEVSNEDLFDEYEGHSNNINMSSVAVQTDALPKVPNRSKKNQRPPSDSPSPPVRRNAKEKKEIKEVHEVVREGRESREGRSSRESRGRQPNRENRDGRQSRESWEGRDDFISGDLTSATLVRKVNHGFGRYDRSPSPPIRRPQRQFHKRGGSVVPLLSDTSDSEIEPRRRYDPMDRIRDQVMLREEEEYDDDEEIPSDHQKAPVIPYRPEEMTPLTIDEVDAMQLEVDTKGRKTYVVSKEAKANKVTHVSNHRSHHSEYVTERHHPTKVIKQTKEPKPLGPPKPPREKNSSKEKPPKTENNTTTLEKNKKNNIEKEKTSKETKEKKPKEKEKKKKRIKIKFFYDPRPQDDPSEDPLAKFEEYKGTSSEDRGSPRDVRGSRDRLDESSPEREVQDTRDRHASRDSLHEEPRERPRDPSRERQRRAGSRDNLDRPESPRGYSYDRREDDRRERRSKEVVTTTTKRSRSQSKEVRDGRDPSRDRYSRDPPKETRGARNGRKDSRDSQDSNNSRDNIRDARETRTRSREAINVQSREKRVTSYEESVDEAREPYDRDGYEPRDGYESREGGDDPHGAPEGDGVGLSLSDKYRGVSLYDGGDDPPSPIEEEPPQQPPTEDDEKQEKILRQRKKFLTSFIEDGRAKSSTPESPTQPNGPVADKPPQPTPTKKKKKRPWPWSLLGLRRKSGSGSGAAGSGGGGSRGTSPPPGPAPPPPRVISSRLSSRASSRASSRSSLRATRRPRRPSVRANKVRRENPESRLWFSRKKKEPEEERPATPKKKAAPQPPSQWESSTLSRAELRARQSKQNTTVSSSRGYSTVQRPHTNRKASAAESTTSSNVNPNPPSNVARTTSFKHRYFGDTDVESRGDGDRRGDSGSGGSGSGGRRGKGGGPARGEFSTLPARTSRNGRSSSAARRNGTNKSSPNRAAGGSAGSSLQSSESEADSHHGSHASRASKASHVSTGSSRSVYLHATTVADIPVKRGDRSVSHDEAPSERGVSRQSKKVSRSFSLLAPWKPRHYREKFEVEYDNREVREAREGREGREGREPRERETRNGRGALPPRPPRRTPEDKETNSKKSARDKKVSRSQSVYKDSRLAGWLRRKKNKEAKE
ncbi:uncharacterized protein LOC143029146 isoform X2 [Oratosquilla oratoria]|uniref:uncharacterized protein LOC143029146 isoform X2 n=1 Tax=Oratosquilla oratoria TaxID=337810 RepID=UPI003F757D91